MQRDRGGMQKDSYAHAYPLPNPPPQAGEGAHRICGTTGMNGLQYHAAAADLPIAAFTRGMTSSAINCIERLLSAGSTQSIPA